MSVGVFIYICVLNSTSYALAKRLAPCTASLGFIDSVPFFFVPRREIIDVLKQQGYTRVLDMTGEEANKKYFEGTGVLLIDRINGVVYVNVSVSFYF